MLIIGLFSSFDGAITVLLIPHPHRAFAFEVTFQLQHPQLISLSTHKPPAHFHPYQKEYMQVLEGRLCIEIEGCERVLGPDDGEVSVEPWANHRLYPPATGQKEDEGAALTRFLLSGGETMEVFRLDTIFFQNWYGYQDEVVMRGAKMDFIQVMSVSTLTASILLRKPFSLPPEAAGHRDLAASQMFDAGASYLSVPWWVPFGRTLSRTVGIVVGRWLGGMLGYQPFYRKWTTDWASACKKMETSFFQKRFADGFKVQ